MDIGIFIEYEGRVVQIPVNPEKFDVSTEGNNSVTELITLGEIIIPKKKKLSSISWESFFPYESWYPAIRTRGAFQSARFYLNFLDKIRDDCKPCRLIVTGIGFDSDVVIDSFDYHHQAGDHEDTYYSITFKTYRPYQVSVISKVDATNQLKRTTAVGTVAPNVVAPTTVVPTAPTQFTVGAEVLVNGTVHLDSYGRKPGKTVRNYTGKISLINKKGSHPYHITSPSGTWLGWVSRESVVLRWT